MRISYIVNEVFDGWSPASVRVGGSEECVIQTAKRFVQQGHEVSVFHNGEHGDFDGVQYKDYAEFETGDVLLNVNYPEFDAKAPQIYWTSLSKNPDLSHFQAVCAISEYAKHNTGIIHDNIHIVAPGYDPEHIYPEIKVEKQCMYASSPDRGLDVLLEAWPKVREVHPDATLITTYGADVDLPGVLCLGNADEDTVDELYRTSDIWCHPCTGIELYCMTGKKAQVAGAIPVIIPHMALAETVERGFKIDKPEDYAQGLIEALSIPFEIRNSIRHNVIEHANASTWEETSAALLNVINSVVKSP